MAFYSGTKTNQNLVFGDKGEIGNSSFAYSEAATVASTENKITASDGTSNDRFGDSVTVGNGRIVVAASSDDDNGDSSGSAYIFDLDGTQLAKITAPDGASFDNFGRSVAVGSGKIVVGVSGDDDNGSSSGSAYIFDLDGTQLAKITASDGATGDYFGSSVAVGNGRIVVGATEDDDNGTSSGSAYIFDLDGTQLAKITASDGAAGDYFGDSVAVGNGRIVVGARFDDDNGESSGSAYIFDLDGTQLSKITASDGVAFDIFGYSVAVGNGRIVVGAYGDDDKGTSSGSAYIFDLDGTQLAKITASDGRKENYFGFSVAVGNGRIVVGAYGNNNYQGSAYIFDLDGTQLAKITTPDGASSDYFGSSVAVGNGRIVVGAAQDGDNGFNSGSAYIYNTNEYYDDYVEKIADNRIGKYTRLTG
jgi:hypothetical protein